MSKFALVVDDEKPLREIICETLKLMDIESIAAESGDQAIAEIQKLNQLDLIILDMNMPLMNGEEAYRQISAEFPNTAVIFMSGYDMQEDLDKMNLTSKNYFLKKPFTITNLQNVVNELLGLN